MCLAGVDPCYPSGPLPAPAKRTQRCAARRTQTQALPPVTPRVPPAVGSPAPVHASQTLPTAALPGSIWASCQQRLVKASGPDAGRNERGRNRPDGEASAGCGSRGPSVGMALHCPPALDGAPAQQLQFRGSAPRHLSPGRHSCVIRLGGGGRGCGRRHSRELLPGHCCLFLNCPPTRLPAKSPSPSASPSPEGRAALPLQPWPHQGTRGGSPASSPDSTPHPDPGSAALWPGDACLAGSGSLQRFPGISLSGTPRRPGPWEVRVPAPQTRLPRRAQ